MMLLQQSLDLPSHSLSQSVTQSFFSSSETTMTKTRCRLLPGFHASDSCDFKFLSMYVCTHSSMHCSCRKHDIANEKSHHHRQLIRSRKDCSQCSCSSRSCICNAFYHSSSDEKISPVAKESSRFVQILKISYCQAWMRCRQCIRVNQQLRGRRGRRGWKNGNFDGSARNWLDRNVTDGEPIMGLSE